MGFLQDTITIKRNLRPRWTFNGLPGMGMDRIYWIYISWNGPLPQARSSNNIPSLLRSPAFQLILPQLGKDSPSSSLKDMVFNLQARRSADTFDYFQMQSMRAAGSARSITTIIFMNFSLWMMAVYPSSIHIQTLIMIMTSAGRQATSACWQ